MLSFLDSPFEGDGARCASKSDLYKYLLLLHSEHIYFSSEELTFPALSKAGKIFYKKTKNMWKQVGIYDIIVAVIFFPKGCL